VTGADFKEGKINFSFYKSGILKQNGKPTNYNKEEKTVIA